MFTFRPNYFFIFFLLVLIEAAIAAFVHDAVIRPFFGDFLAVIALYFFLKSVFRLKDLTLALVSVGFAFFLEFLQYCHFIAFAGLENYKIIVIMLGNSFDWRDIFAYISGFLSVLLFPDFKNITQKILNYHGFRS